MAANQLPGVIVNIMRGSPGLGSIQGSQGDYFQATRGGGHGDYHTIVLAPSSVQEAVELTIQAFDLSDSYRIPVMLLGDGILGQMMEPIEFPEISRKKIPLKPWALTGCKGRKPNKIQSLLMATGQLEKHVLELEKTIKKLPNRKQNGKNFKQMMPKLLLLRMEL